MAELSGENLWIDDDKIIASIKRIETGIESLAKKSEDESKKINDAFGTAMVGAVEKLISKLAEAKTLLDSMPEAKVAISTATAEQSLTGLNTVLSEIVSGLNRVSDAAAKVEKEGDALSKAFGTAGSGAKMLEDMVSNIAKPLQETATSMKRLTDQMGVMSKADFRKVVKDTQGEGFKKIQTNVDALYDALGRLYSVQAQKGPLGLNGNEVDTIEARIKKLRETIRDLQDTAGKPAKEKALGNILADLGKIDDAPLQRLKKGYKELLDFLGRTPMNSAAWNNAAMELMHVGEKIDEVNAKTKLLPLSMSKFEKAIKKLDYTQLIALDRVLQDTMKVEGTNAEAMERLSKKQKLVAEAIESIDIAALRLGTDLKMLNFEMESDYVSAARLRSIFGELKNELANASWKRGDDGRLKVQYDGIEESIQKCVVRMKEFQRAEQDVLAASGAVGQSAINRINTVGVGNMNSVELERLASDLKLAMRYLDEGSDAWKRYREALKDVQKQQKVLNDLMDVSEKKIKKTKEEVVYAEGSLGALRKALSDLGKASSQSAFGSKMWHDLSMKAASYADEFERIQRQTRLAQQSNEQFGKSLVGLKDKEAYRQMLNDLKALQNTCVAGTMQWNRYDERIKALVASYRQMREEAEAAGRPRSLDAINDSVTKNHSNLSVLRKDYQDLINLVVSSDYGSAQFYSAGAAANALSAKIKELELRERTLTEPMEQFKASIRNMDKDGLQQLYSQINGLRNAAKSMGADSAALDVYREKLIELNTAIRNVGAAAKESPKILALEMIETAAEKTKRALTNQISLNERALTSVKAALNSEQAALVALEQELNRTIRLKASLMATGRPERHPDVVAYQNQIDSLNQRITSAKNNITSMEGYIGRAENTIRKLTDALNMPFTPKALDAFRSELKTLSKSDLDTVVKQLEQMRDQLAKKPDGSLSERFKEMEAYIKAANAELERTTALMAGAAQTKYAWENDVAKMSNVGQNANSVKTLEELKALHSALYAEIAKCDNLTGSMAQRMIQAYQTVGKKISETEEKIRGVQKASQQVTAPTGADRTWADIMASVFSADASIRTLTSDIGDLQSKILSLKYDQLQKGDQEWVRAVENIRRAVNEYGNWKERITMTNEALQQSIDKLALIRRETSSSGNASMGRWDNGKGYQEIFASIKDATTTSERLKRDMADIQAIMERTAKYDAAGNITKEWRQLDYLLSQVTKRIKEYNAERSGGARKTTYDDAMRVAQAANTYNRLSTAIRMLKEVQAGMRPDDPRWNTLVAQIKASEKAMEELRKKMGEVKAKANEMTSDFGQLKSLIMQAFTIQAIYGFLKKMTEVHAQMHLQNIAMRAIIQDKAKADQIFGEVQQMALQSPFTIMQLTTYTKQLAAYRIESEKLVDTTKRLADVSAGLGVDMSRIILAYGQIKAANYLRATEVRQLTEAGLNIYGELSAYFTEMKGQMVSVADVMDMVTKRLVKFSDVEEVFKRITSEGGLFYNMQKKQADSIHGMIQRIQDAYTIMLDQIGTSNQSTLKTVLTTIREVIGAWRTFLPLIKGAIAYFGILYTFKGFGALATSIGQATVAVKALKTALGLAVVEQQKLNIAQMASGWGALIGIVGALTYGIYTLCTAEDELTERMENQRAEAETDANDAVGRFKQLIKVLNDTTATYKEQREALEEIKRSYSGVFTSQEMEIENIRKMGNSWKDTEARMREYYANQLAQKQEQTIREDETKKIQENITKIVGNEGLKAAFDGYSETVGRQIMNDIIEQIKNGEVAADDFFKVFIARLKEFYGVSKIPLIEMNAIVIGAKDFWDRLKKSTSLGPDNNSPENTTYFDNIIEAMDKAQEKIAEIDTSTIGVQNKDQQRINKMLSERNDLTEKYKNLLNEVHALNVDKDEANPLGKFLGEDGEFASEQAQRLFGDINQCLKDMGLAAMSSGKDVLALADNFVTIERSADTAKVNTIKSMHSIFSAMYANRPEMIKFIDDTFGRIEQGFDTKGIKDNITEVFELAASLNNVDVDIFQNIDRENTSNAIKDLNGEYEKLKDTLEAVNRVKNSILTTDQKQIMLDYYLQGRTEEEIQREMKAIDDAMHALGGKNKVTDKKQQGKGKDPWSERLNMIKKVVSEYEKLLKYYDQEEAKRRILASFGPAAAEVFKGVGKYGDISTWLGFDKESASNMLDDMLKKQKISADTRKKIQEEIGSMRSEVDIKQQEDALEKLKNDVESLFADFDLTKTFRELGVNDSLMTTLFGARPIADLAELRQMVDELAESVRQSNLLGEDYDKWYADQIKKIGDLEAKQRQEQAKNWVKYTKEAMSERGRIIMEAMQEQNRIMRGNNLNDATKSLALDQLKKKTDEQLAKRDWDDFKGTDMYIKMFEDLEWASTESIRRMRASLESLKDGWKGLPPDQMKALVKEMDKLDKELMERNPFTALKKSLQEVAKLKAQGQTISAIENEIADYTRQNEAIKEQITELETVKALRITAAEGGELTADQMALQSKYANKTNHWLDEQIKRLNNIKVSNNKILAESQANLDSYKKAKESIDEAKAKWGEYYEAANKAFGLVKEALEAMGVDMDSVGGIVADSIMKLADLGVQAILTAAMFKVLGTAVKSAMGIIGYILIALEAVVTIMTAIFAAGDKKKEREIQRLKDTVDKLSKSYEKLKESIENAYKIDDYRNGVRQAKVNLEHQIAAYKEMVRLEEAKKKSDKNALKEYRDKLDELKDELKELSNEQTKAMGGFGSDTRFDAAEAFVDAWLSAFKETGDGLDALEEQWDGYIENLFKKQAAYRLAGKRLQNFFDMVDRAANANSSASIKEIIENVNALQGDLLSKLNDELKEYFDYLGINGGGDLLLSDLQQGIRNITEEQAAALESIANSMRFGIWRQVDLLTELVAVVGRQYGGQDNSQVEELRGIHRETSEIRTLLQSVIRRSGGPDGKPYIRVY